jgi:hypothetical protein
LYVFKKVYNVVGLPEIVLNVVIFGGDSELDKFVLERSTLLEKAVNLTFDFHLSFILVSNPFPQLWPAGGGAAVYPSLLASAYPAIFMPPSGVGGKCKWSPLYQPSPRHAPESLVHRGAIF